MDPIGKNTWTIMDPKSYELDQECMMESAKEREDWEAPTR